MNVRHLRNISSVKIVKSDESFPGKNYSTVAYHNIQVWRKKYLAYEFNFCKWFFQNCFFSKGRSALPPLADISDCSLFRVVRQKTRDFYQTILDLTVYRLFCKVLLAYFQFSIRFFKTFIEWLLLLKVRDLYV